MDDGTEGSLEIQAGLPAVSSDRTASSSRGAGKSFGAKCGPLVWAAVTTPLLWGVWVTLERALVLFR